MKYVDTTSQRGDTELGDSQLGDSGLWGSELGDRQLGGGTSLLCRTFSVGLKSPEPGGLLLCVPVTFF